MYEKNALNNFKDVLGKYCAINQFIELSKRCFVAEHQKEMTFQDASDAECVRKESMTFGGTCQ